MYVYTIMSMQAYRYIHSYIGENDHLIHEVTCIRHITMFTDYALVKGWCLVNGYQAQFMKKVSPDGRLLYKSIIISGVRLDFTSNWEGNEFIHAGSVKFDTYELGEFVKIVNDKTLLVSTKDNLDYYIFKADNGNVTLKLYDKCMW